MEREVESKMWVSRYFVWFTVYSCMGWIWETTFCTMKSKKWENRGFLYGPVVPIYGVGAVAISAVIDCMRVLNGGSDSYVWWQIFLIAFLGSIVLEYGTSWALEKIFHAYWWDYSEMPLNINGRVCFPYSVGFGIAGLIIVYGIYPFMAEWTAKVPALVMELYSLIAMAIMASDCTLTVSALTQFDENLEAMSERIDQHMTQWVEAMESKKQRAEEKIHEERELAHERMRAERDKISHQHMDELLAHMNTANRSALNRVQGFSKNKDGDKRERVEKLREAIQMKLKKQK